MFGFEGDEPSKKQRYFRVREADLVCKPQVYIYISENNKVQKIKKEAACFFFLSFIVCNLEMLWYNYDRFTGKSHDRPILM